VFGESLCDVCGYTCVKLTVRTAHDVKAELRGHHWGFSGVSADERVTEYPKRTHFDAIQVFRRF